jgi:hypothetical protein
MSHRKTRLVQGLGTSLLPIRLVLTVLGAWAASLLVTGWVFATDVDPAAAGKSPPKSSSSIEPYYSGAEADAKKEEAETSALDMANLGGMAGGAAGTGAALPTLQGDTTWGGRPAYPHAIAPAMLYPSAYATVLNNNVDHLVFTSNIAPFLVDSNSLPQSLNSADLVFGLIGLPLGAIGGPANTYLPLSATLLSSPIIGYNMINWAENASIIPQDRVFFDYRHFDAVGSLEVVNLIGDSTSPNLHYAQQAYFPLSVDRYVVGFEKTFRQGLWSVEARFPMQYQAASTQTVNGPFAPANDTEVGNIGVALKRYLVRGDRWTITGGMGVQLPTAPNTDFSYRCHISSYYYGGLLSAELDESIRVRQTNETVWLNPFLGFVYDRKSRFFAEGMVQLCVPLNPSSASLSTTVENGQLYIGNWLYDFTAHPINNSTNIPMAFETLFRGNVDLGYWLYQNPSGRINGIAALVELDDTNTIGKAYAANVVNMGPQLVVEAGKTEFATGMLVPVSGDQAYKWEVTARVNRRF